MSPVFKKLNLKDQKTIVVVKAPESFESELALVADRTVIRDLKQAKTIEFALVFATRQTDVDKLSRLLAQKAVDDAVVWIAYPKGTSKKYQCDFNRDTGWTVLRDAGFDTVRQVAIDEDWSALRFRHVQHIKSH